MGLFSVDNTDRDEFELMMKCLIVTLWEGGYPHEIICHMYNAQLEKSDDVVDLEEVNITAWSPSEIVEQLSNSPLWKLCKDLQDEYISISSLPKDFISPCFIKLNFEMFRKVAQIIRPFDQNAHERWKSILNHLVGETSLKDYFGQNPNDNISDWSYRVLRKVRRFIVEGNWLDRPIEELCKEVKRSWIREIEKDDVIMG